MPTIGDPAPDFDAPTDTGKSLKLSSIRGGRIETDTAFISPTTCRHKSIAFKPPD